MGRKDHGLFDRVQSGDDAAEPRLDDVGVAVDRGHDVRPRLEPEPLEHVRAFARDRREREAGVGHDVTHHLDPAGHAFGLEDAA